MKLIFFCAFALLLAYAALLNWQAAGNMSASNMTIIQGYINANFSMGEENLNTLPGRVGPFSDYLNGLWAPAWNVVIIYNGKSNEKFDAILYGYAFRDHWMWINGLSLLSFSNPSSTITYYGTILIWKDYNCKGWLTLNVLSDNQGTFTSNPNTAINDFMSNYAPIYGEIWDVAWKAVTYLETSATDFKGDHAYTMVASQGINCYYFGQVCASNYYAKTINPFINDPVMGNWGSYLLLQMR